MTTFYFSKFEKLWEFNIFENLFLAETNLSQIRTLDIKREKVCAVCPYLLLYFFIPGFNK